MSNIWKFMQIRYVNLFLYAVKNIGPQKCSFVSLKYSYLYGVSRVWQSINSIVFMLVLYLNVNLFLPFLF